MRRGRRMSVPNISKQQQNSLRFAVMRFGLLMHKAGKRKRKTGNRSPQRNHRSQSRNEVEPSPLHFWAEGSTQRSSTQHFRSNLQPIYQAGRAEALAACRPVDGSAISTGTACPLPQPGFRLAQFDVDRAGSPNYPATRSTSRSNSSSGRSRSIGWA